MSLRRPSRVSAVAVVVLVALAAGAAGGFVARPMLDPPKTAAADHRSAAPPPAGISALARLQPLGGVIPIYGPPGDRLATLENLQPGQLLKAGTEIARLASYDQHATEVQVAEIQLAEAKQQLELAKTAGEKKIATGELEASQVGADEERNLKALDAQIRVLTEQDKIAAAQVARLTKIVAEGVKVPVEEQEQARLLRSKAGAELEAAIIKKENAVGDYKNARALAESKLTAARAEMKEAIARVPIESTKKKLEQAKQLLELAVIKAPVDGRVLKVAQHVGEPTGPPQPILYMAASSKMVAVAEVYESDVPRLRQGLSKGTTFSARVTSPALPEGAVLSGTLANENQVAQMIARNAIFALSPREDTDRRVVEVTVPLDDASSAIAAPYVGLQVTVGLSPSK